LSLCLIDLQKAVGQKTVGRHPYALVHVQSFSDEPWVMPKKKIPVFDAGTSVSHDLPQS